MLKRAGQAVLDSRPWRWFWGMVWDLSEFTGVGLGRFAPWVFGFMIGSWPRRMD